MITTHQKPKALITETPSIESPLSYLCALKLPPSLTPETFLPLDNHDWICICISQNKQAEETLTDSYLTVLNNYNLQE